MGLTCHQDMSPRVVALEMGMLDLIDSVRMARMAYNIYTLGVPRGLATPLTPYSFNDLKRV